MQSIFDVSYIKSPRLRSIKWNRLKIRVPQSTSQPAFPQRAPQDPPPCQVPTCVALDDYCSLSEPFVPDPLQPTPHCLLNHDCGSSELICSQFLQISHLACTEKDLGMPKLELVWILFKNIKETTFN